MTALLPVACEQIDLEANVCSIYPPSGVLVCSLTVICGQWRVGQLMTEDDTGWGPALCTPLDLLGAKITPHDLVAAVCTPLDLDALVCEEA